MQTNSESCEPASHSSPRYPRGNKTYVHTKTSTWMFTEALFSNSWQLATIQMPTNKWTSKQIMVYPHSGIQQWERTKPLTPEATYNYLKRTKQSERIQARRCIWDASMYITLCKSKGNNSGLVVSHGGGVGSTWGVWTGAKRNFWGQ